MRFLKSKFLLAFLILLLAFTTIGCGNNASNTAQSFPKGVSVAGGALGGTFYVWATGFGQVISEKMDIQSNVEVTAGPVANFQLIDAKEADFGLVTIGPAWEGINGEGWADGKTHENVRGLFPAFPSYLHWVTPVNKNINNINNFADKVVNLGASGTTSETYGRKILELLDIKPTRIINSSFNDANDQMKDGTTDVSVVVGGLPFPSVSEFTETENAIIGGFESTIIEQIINTYPYFGSTVIEKGTYKGQQEDVTTLDMWNVMVTHSDLSEDFVYEVMKTTFENVDFLTSVHQSAENIQFKNVPSISSIPLHVGAIKFYEEQGVELPESAYPPEYKK